MTTRLIAGPTTEPVTRDEAKLHLRVDLNVEDTLIDALISSARQEAETRTNRVFGTQTWELVLDEFPSSGIALPFPPVASITSIKYDDTSAAEQTLSPTEYRARLSGEPAYVMPVTAWPETLGEPGCVRIRFVCGVQPTDANWQALRQWMLLAIATVYSNREAMANANLKELPRTFFDGKLDGLRFYG